MDISAENTYSQAQEIKGGFNLSLSGTWSATVHVQRSFDTGATWVDVDNFTANTEQTGTEPEAYVLYRVGVKTGNYTSGTVKARLSR